MHQCVCFATAIMLSVYHLATPCRNYFTMAWLQMVKVFDLHCICVREDLVTKYSNQGSALHLEQTESVRYIFWVRWFSAAFILGLFRWKVSRGYDKLQNHRTIFYPPKMYEKYNSTTVNIIWITEVPRWIFSDGSAIYFHRGVRM